ncbi:unnamed protein product [Cylindrotheca closterium]|uniref:Pentacotripeptide-repeat region of PRORP domain-containing protein n=1 Tax=Cylindrotheca closterium TaxID=2856 RepID=A0AAD2FVK2_9STRA|nr:unnamed protein product [Cylindrotheca closterium]
MKSSRLALRSLGHFQRRYIRSRKLQPSNLSHQDVNEDETFHGHVSIRRFFSSSTSSNTPSIHHAQAREFLDKLKTGSFNTSIVPQRVEQLLIALLKGDNTANDGPLALQLLNSAIMHSNLPNERLIPRLFSLACQIMVRSGHSLAWNEVHHQIWRLLDGHKEFLINDIPYNTHHVNDACVQLISLTVSQYGRKRRMDHNTSQKIQQLIAELKRQYKDPKIPLGASVDGFNSFIMYYCDIGKPNKALEQLHWMLNVSSKSKQMLEPKLSSFSLTISGFANDSDPDKATEIIQWMLSSYKNKASPIPAPNRACFNGLLHAWAKSSRKDAGSKAERVLDWMQQLYESDQLDTQPDDISFATCINAWARSPGRESPARAEALLHKMLILHESGNGDSIKLSLSAFCSVMDAWAGSGDRAAPQKVDAILDIVEERSSSMEDFELTAFPYTILIKSWERAASGTKDRNRQLECSDNAFKVLTRMQNMGIVPPPTTYNATIMALNSSSPMNAIFYFLQLEEQYRQCKIKLDTRTFNCGLNAIASMMKPDAAEKATEMLSRMKEYATKDSYVQPDETTFNIILKVLSRSNLEDAAHRADELLQDMITMKSIRSSHVSFSTCIIAWGRSQAKDKIQRVEKLLVQFEKTQKKNQKAGKVGSNAVYNAVLSVCYHNGSGEFLDQARETATIAMQTLRNAKATADKATYESFFKVMTFAPVDPAKENLVETEFRRCIEDGLVSVDSLKVVKAVFPSVAEKYLGEHHGTNGESIPRQWSKQIRSGSRR